MNELYKKMKKENNLLIKELSGEYALFISEFVREIRKYAIKTQNTELKLKQIIEETITAYINQVRFSTYIPSKEEYLNKQKKEFIKDTHKPKYTTKEIIIITLCLTFFIGFAIIGIILKQPVDFDPPKNVTIENGTVYFEEVKYAKEYVIRITNASGKLIREIYLDDEDPEVVNIFNYKLSTLSELNNPGTYLIKIKTLSNKIYQDSKWSKEVVYVKYD